MQQADAPHPHETHRCCRRFAEEESSSLSKSSHLSDAVEEELQEGEEEEAGVDVCVGERLAVDVGAQEQRGRYNSHHTHLQPESFHLNSFSGNFVWLVHIEQASSSLCGVRLGRRLTGCPRSSPK